MTCRRAFEADLPAVLHGESADAEFLAHYPGCPECATEVGVWRELDGLLRTRTASHGGAHPDPETLVAFADATLAERARADVAHHLATCRVCADELKALAGFDPGHVAAAVRGEPASRPARSALARIVWHPAFAYALVAVLLVPIVLERWPQMETRIAEERAPEPPPPAPLAEHDVAGHPLPAPPPAPLAAELRREPAPEAQVANTAPVAKRRADDRPDTNARSARAADREARHEGGTAAFAGRMREPPAAPAGAARMEAERGAPRALADAAAPPRVLAIQAGTAAVFPPPADDEAVRLRIALPPRIGPGPVDVIVRARAGAASLRTRITDAANAIEVDIPPAWLRPGDYVVVLRNEDPRQGSPVWIAFTIRAPAVRP